MIKIPIQVLVVDDDKEFVDMISSRLGKAGERVTPAYSGHECLDLLRKKDIDVVLLDIGMPGMNGIQTLKELKRQFPLVEVIIMTSHGSIQSAVEGMKLGAFDYLLKPTELTELREKLEQARTRKEEHADRIRRAETRFFLRKIGDV
ncbi:MAG: response regulator [Desulfobacterales bacterium]|nr:response regulator [Desulfobacterales bacterium]MDD4071000.1 response regulator [Desulfobacterales bacterium]MDD4391913.1 response regulator [Desulfobacterales bacterium]